MYQKSSSFTSRYLTKKNENVRLETCYKLVLFLIAKNRNTPRVQQETGQTVVCPYSGILCNHKTSKLLIYTMWVNFTR